MKFKTKIVQIGNNTGINVPEKIIEAFNAGKKPPVLITIKKHSYQNTVAVMGGLYMVSLSAENRKKANVTGGEEVEVTIELDKEPRTVDLPVDFRKALDNNAVAKENFEALSNSRKKYLVLPVLDAKTEDTRVRRIEKAIAELTIEKK